jgi:hypothetical protein
MAYLQSFCISRMALFVELICTIMYLCKNVYDFPVNVSVIVIGTAVHRLL